MNKAPKNRIDYYKGFNLSKNNANDLLKAAQVVAENGLWGTGCALCVLSCEESIKACFILVKEHHPNTDIEAYNDIFRKHYIKHENIVELIGFFQSAINQREAMSSSFMAIYKQLDSKMKPQFNKAYSTLFEDLEFISQMKSLERSHEEVKAWWKKADDLKKKGFYVDQPKETGNWISPTDLTQEDYLEAEKILLATDVINESGNRSS
jgi:AbiV family abortive infection protein